jgi:hypothetical protein
MPSSHRVIALASKQGRLPACNGERLPIGKSCVRSFVANGFEHGEHAPSSFFGLSREECATNDFSARRDCSLVATSPQSREMLLLLGWTAPEWPWSMCARSRLC